MAASLVTGWALTDVIRSDATLDLSTILAQRSATVSLPLFIGHSLH